MKDISEAVSYYKDCIGTYESLAHKVVDIIRENLKENDIQYHSVTSRVKSLESYTNKAKNEKYSDVINEIKDMAGIRVITYLESDVKRAAIIIEKLFDIDKANSIDQSQLLGSDRLGYRSVHYVAKFGRSRCKLPENTKFKGFPFEIQIRSLLQHAWAEIEHDRNYKFTGKLPTQLERRFYLVAGMLEMADREFMSIAQEIDEYKNTVAEELDKGELDIEINTASLTEYLSNKFEKSIHEGVLLSEFGSGNANDKVIVEELKLFGISKLYELDKIIPHNYQDDLLKSGILKFPPALENYSSIIRDVLIINDLKKYFKFSWRNSWKYIFSNDIEKLKRYKVDTDYMQKFVYIDNL
jgi:ppGpp synthetase/RelA/SpoT-type nucleotidyltranferase